MEQYIENKNQLLGDLYALRAGMSAISVEKDKLDVSEKKYKNVLGNVQKARDKYEKYDYDIQRVLKNLNYYNSRLPRGYSMSAKTQSKGLCSIGRTKIKSGRAETDKSKLNRKRVIELPEKMTTKNFKTE